MLTQRRRGVHEHRIKLIVIHGPGWPPHIWAWDSTICPNVAALWYVGKLRLKLPLTLKGFERGSPYIVKTRHLPLTTF
jgi:hypothetical protein